MGNCNDCFLDEQIERIIHSAKKVERMRKSKEKEIQRILDAYEKSRSCGDGDGEETYKQLVCGLMEEKRHLSRMAVMLSRLKGRLVRARTEGELAEHLGTTKVIVARCVEYIQKGAVSKMEVETLLDMAGEAGADMLAGDNDVKPEAFEEVLAKRAMAALPSVPKLEMGRTLVYESI
jgi:hypothetical protein